MHRVAVTALVMSASVGLASSIPDTRHPTPDTFHLRLTRSEPRADSTVNAVGAIKLWFSQQPDARLTTIRLTGPGERIVPLGPPAVSADSGSPIVAAVSGSPGPGRYSVTWRTMSRDGHPVSGTFAFTLAPAGTASQQN